MDGDQVLLSDELLVALRQAVSFAVDYGAAFVAPAHLLLALLDDPKVGPALGKSLERGRVVAAARATSGSALYEVPEGPLPRGEKAPFKRYDTVIFQSADGQYQRWLTRDAFKIFNESARRANGGRFLPRHLALGLWIVSQDDREARMLLGDDAEGFRNAVYALK